MSLQLAAKHLAAHGRGKDTELIHMDKGEIASLQKVAMAHGGSLTINPQTGLPEAGFLSAILPMALGAGLMMVPGMQAGAAGLIVGGLQTARTGSLQKGIMAGLGAYGGAGLAGSAGAAGASSVPTATPAVTPTPEPFSAYPAGTPGTPVTGGNFVQGTALPSMPSIPPTTVGTSGSAGMDQFLGQYGGAPAGTAPIPNPSAGLSNTIPQYGPSFTDAQAFDPSTLNAPTSVKPPSFDAMNASQRAQAIKSGASFSNAADWASNNKLAALGAAGSVAAGMQNEPAKVEPDKDMGQRYAYSANTANPIPAPDVPSYEDMLTKQGNFGRPQSYFTPKYTPISATAAKGLYNFAGGGPVELMSDQAAIGANTGYPMANMTTSAFATPYQDPRATSVLAPSGGASVNQMTGELNPQGTRLAGGGLSDARYNLGSYSDGGRLLRGPGDGVSDSIPAVIGKKQPARLADGEFVVPARIVSELGNGSTEAGARKLYAMMDRIQASRKNTVGKGKVAKNNRADKYLPA